MSWNVGRTPPASGNMITAGHGPAPAGVCRLASRVPSGVSIITSRCATCVSWGRSVSPDVGTAGPVVTSYGSRREEPHQGDDEQHHADDGAHHIGRLHALLALTAAANRHTPPDASREALRAPQGEDLHDGDGGGHHHPEPRSPEEH